MSHPPFKAVGDRVRIFGGAKVIGHEYIELGRDIIVDDFVMLVAKDETKIGSFVHIGAFSSIMGGGKLVMDDFSGLSAGVRVWTGSDDFLGNALTNPTVPIEYRNVTRSFVNIGRHVIVGSNAVILPGVTIGEGAAIGAGSIVKHDVEPWTVYVNGRTMPRRRDIIQQLEAQLLLAKGST